MRDVAGSMCSEAEGSEDAPGIIGQQGHSEHHRAIDKRERSRRLRTGEHRESEREERRRDSIVKDGVLGWRDGSCEFFPSVTSMLIMRSFLCISAGRSISTTVPELVTTETAVARMVAIALT